MLRASSIAVNDLIPSDNRNSNSIVPVSKLVVKDTSFSLISLPLPAAMFPMVASKKLSPLPDAGKSNLSAGDSVVKTSPFDSNLAEPFITAAILAEIGAAVGEISNASTV